MTRGLQVVFCALLLTLTSSPAWGVCRPENRVWKIFSEPSKTASADLDQTLEPRGESGGCGYDFASGVHKYLYAQDDPVMLIDPTGHEGDLISFSVASTIGTALDSAYNGNVITVGFALQASAFGAYNHQSENQVLAGYYINTAVGLAAGYAIGKIVKFASESIYGGEIEFVGSASAASREAAVESQAILDGEEAAVTEAGASQTSAKGYGGLDKMLPGTLKEGDVIYSTVPPDKINGGLWATDARGMVRAAGSSKAYKIGTQTVKPRDTVYAYRVKTKVPCAAGNAEWNNQNGEGGFPQYYITKDNIGNIEKVAEFPLQ